MCVGTAKGATRMWANVPFISRPTPEQIKLLQPKNTKEGGVSAKTLMEFESDHDDIEKTFKEIAAECQDDKDPQNNKRTHICIHYEAVGDLQEAAATAGSNTNVLAISRWCFPCEVRKIALNAIMT